MSPYRFFSGRFAALACAVLTLSACSTAYQAEQRLMANGQYWQRADASSSIYMQGPKAQQILTRDISRCTTEINEYREHGLIREAMPADGAVPDPDSAEGRMARWESPRRDGYLLNEHLDYHDFESCMAYKGWKRAEYLPYDTAVKARESYIRAMIDEGYRTGIGFREEAPSTDGSQKRYND